MSVNEAENLVVIGISGVTCGGKTTTAQKLQELLPNCKIISQDDYFFKDDDSRHTWITELNHVNYDIITSLDMEKLYQDAVNILNDVKVKRITHNSKICKEYKNFQSICNELKSSKLQVLIIEGFSIFNYEPLVPLFDLKYYFTLSEEECYHRRLNRVYDPPDVPGYFEKCAWPEHVSQLKEVRTKVNDVVYFSGTDKPDEVVKRIITDILECICGL